MPKRIEVFFSCAPEDELLRKELEKHLSQLYREGLINIWHRFSVKPGSEVDETLVRHLNKAPVILLLISANFIASNDCYNIEMLYAMQRHEQGTARVIPILLEPADWQSAPFAKLKPLPSNGIPITLWSNQSEAFARVVREFREVIKDLARSDASAYNATKAELNTPDGYIELGNAETGSIGQSDSQLYSTHHLPEEAHGSYQQPYDNYQQPSSPIAQTTKTVIKVGTPTTKPSTTIAVKWVIIAIVATIVLGASGVGVALAFHSFHLSLTQPKINITSTYNAQGLPVGADGTTFHVSGQHFAANSAITFLLDNTPLDEAQQTQSDGNGNVKADLAVTSAWSVGQHTLTAHDAGNTFTTSGIQINVVQPGESNTPGPGGAPPDDASFTIQVNGQGTNTNGVPVPYIFTLIITGHPDPAGGSVCASRDNGTPISNQSPSVSNASVIFNSRSTYSCSGTYKGGKFSYSETLQTNTVDFSNGMTCTLNTPVQSYRNITGSYTNQHNFSGNLTVSPLDKSMFTCTPAGSYTWALGNQGTWTGTVSQS